MSDEPPVSVGRYEWDRIVRRCILPAPVKHTAAALSQYANADGTRIYPGVARLSAVTSLSERTVRGALGVLRELGLITRTRKGSSLGRQAVTDEHRLTYPVDLMRRVHMLDPEENPLSARCTPACEHPLSPARPAGDRVPVATEHRQMTHGTPAAHAGTPAPHDTNTGTSCTPPPKDQPTTTQIDQRENQDPNLRTEGDVLAELIEIDRIAERRRQAR